MKTGTHSYFEGKREMLGFLATPGDGQRHPGILLAPEGPGLGKHARQRAAKLAECGYIVLAVDLHGGGRVASSHEETMALATPLVMDRNLLRARMSSGLNALVAVPDVDQRRLGAIGYCLGGLAALELARSGAPILGTVTFHGLLGTLSRDGGRKIYGKILVCTGADDHLVPPVDLAAFEDEMSAAKVDWQIIRYGGAKHAFTNALEAEAHEKLGFGYDALADRRSWQAMRFFLGEILA